tara:strand:+ start:140 stop:319 length:180 start_codon:yes stop_codon:yes gene_type:complete
MEIEDTGAIKKALEKSPPQANAIGRGNFSRPLLTVASHNIGVFFNSVLIVIHNQVVSML